jgi:hypothetical protein
MAEYTVTTTPQQEAGLERLRLDAGYETKQEVIDKIVKPRAERRLREYHHELIVKGKTIETIKTEIDNA